MSEKAMYRGFDPEKQAKQEAWIVNRYGPGAQTAIDTQQQATHDWKQADYDRSQAEIAAILTALAKDMADAMPADSGHVREDVRRLHAWVTRSWVKPPNREAFLGLANLYGEHPEFRALYEARAVGLTDYIMAAMRAFAEVELN